MKAFMRGVSRILDLGGFTRIRYKLKSDASALASDWRIVGHDLHIAIRSHSKVVAREGNAKSAKRE